MDHLQRLHLPYTVIDVGWWYQISLPRLPSGRIDRNLFPYNTAVGGNGDVPCTRTDSRDVGVYVSRIIADPRTLNQKVFAYTDLRPQHQLYDTVEKLSGENFERKYVCFPNPRIVPAPLVSSNFGGKPATDFSLVAHRRD